MPLILLQIDTLMNMDKKLKYLHGCLRASLSFGNNSTNFLNFFF